MLWLALDPIKRVEGETYLSKYSASERRKKGYFEGQGRSLLSSRVKFPTIHHGRKRATKKRLTYEKVLRREGYCPFLYQSSFFWNMILFLYLTISNMIEIKNLIIHLFKNSYLVSCKVQWFKPVKSCYVCQVCTEDWAFIFYGCEKAPK